MLTIIQNDPKVTLSAYADYLAEMVGAYRTFHPYAGEALPPVAEADAVITLGGAMGVHDTDRHPFLAAGASIFNRTIFSYSSLWRIP